MSMNHLDDEHGGNPSRRTSSLHRAPWSVGCAAAVPGGLGRWSIRAAGRAAGAGELKERWPYWQP